MVDFLQNQKEQHEEAMNKAKGIESATPQNSQPVGPNIKPSTYSTTVSKK